MQKNQLVVMQRFNIINMMSKYLYVLQAVLTPDNWQKIDQCDVLLVLGDGDCGYTYQGKSYAPLIDSLGDLCVNHGLKTGSVFTHFSKLTGINTYNPKTSYNRTALIYALLSRMVQLIVGREKTMAWVNKRRANLWGNILEIAKPVCVIGIQPDEGLCRASKTKGIPIYDFQHGVIDDRHICYGKDYCSNKIAENLVDGFLCWDESSASTLRKWAPQKGIEVKVVGNPWFSRFVFANKNDLLVQEVLNSGQIFRNDRPVVLVSLQWGMMDFIDKSTGFNGLMVDALKKTILETAATFNWLLRLHPIQMRGPEKTISHNYLTHTFGHLDSVEWQLSSELPLPVVLQQTDLHITDSSTVVVEAAWMGIRSALLNVNICPGGTAESYYSYERALGLAEVIMPETNIIKQWIADTYKKGRGKSTFKDTRKLLNTFIEYIAIKAVTKRK